ncbi:dysbindin protein homolog isoform X2 [Sitophilus oryzae]|uniref:Dysbindin domain-containing protein 1 n=1 Tax=Sitophilus oryzae TaxID=7048 RepID=A0A6J2Y0E6_SITOR|nr:dysbindin protein homolog isoform X2 [Sitophilus oryzae]
MLTSIKDKILNVTKNVGLFVSDEKEQKSGEKSNFNAGSSILQHFQNSWCELHDLNEQNTKRANEVADDIEKISGKISSSRENISLINHVLTNSGITSSISQCLDQVKQLYFTCETIEHKLFELEELIEYRVCENEKQGHLIALESFKVRKNESLEEGYQNKVREYELRTKDMLEMRQKVFHEAFKTDLEIYKSQGTIPKVDLNKQQNGAILEEIQLDFDQIELEKFFEDNTDQKTT